MKDHEVHGAAFTQFEDLLYRDDDHLFDGFPLHDPRIESMQQPMPVFRADQIIKESTNKDFFVGVFVPLDVGKWVSGLLGDDD